MKSNYKKLGGYIRQVDERNKDLRLKRLLGVSISKVFIESIANLNGTEMNNYKIVKRNQFAYGPVTSRNGEKVSIACLNSENECIISSSYAVFEIIDTTKLLPEYLMLWFKRPEFDRYARFHSHGSVREIFGWDELCNVELPIPSLLRQKEIVDAYETIESRIKLKRQINDNLVATAKCILSSFLESFDASEISISDYCSVIKAGGTPSRANNSFWSSNDYPWIKNGDVKNNIIISAEEFISEIGFRNSSARIVSKHSVLMAMYCVSTPQLAFTDIVVTTNQAVCSMTCFDDLSAAFLYYYLMFYGQPLVNNANGSAQINLNKEKIGSFHIPFIPSDSLKRLGLLQTIKYRTEIAKEIHQLENVQQNLITQLSRY